MKHKKIVITAIVILAVALTGLAIWWGQGKDSEGPLIIKGRVTHILNECQFDGVCMVTLDDSKNIVTGCGLGPGGTTCKSYDQSKLHNGQQVEATVMKDEASGEYNLECDSCTIRVVE